MMAKDNKTVVILLKNDQRHNAEEEKKIISKDFQIIFPVL
jgi:hypothetical protein